MAVDTDAAFARDDIIFRSVWWKHPPKPGQTDKDLQWGWLLIYEDKSCEFIEQQPSAADMRNREHCLQQG